MIEHFTDCSTFTKGGGGTEGKESNSEAYACTGRAGQG